MQSKETAAASWVLVPRVLRTEDKAQHPPGTGLAGAALHQKGGARALGVFARHCHAHREERGVLCLCSEAAAVPTATEEAGGNLHT